VLRDCVFYDFTCSLCSTCGELCDAKIIIKNGSAFLLKNCGRAVRRFRQLGAVSAYCPAFFAASAWHEQLIFVA
jgi:hypothetical protein